jgi:hypothetical protein
MASALFESFRKKKEGKGRKGEREKERCCERE